MFFQQVAVPGREAAIDFTHATDLGVTIAGDPFPHLLFEFVLSYSHWTWVAIAFGETFEALAAGVQGALWALGGVPAVLRSDNLSAATHELKASSGRDLTPRFRAVLEHYGMRSSRITPGKAHENGVAEQAHRRLKSLVAQALLVRGHAAFDDLAAYDAFVQEVVAYWRNRPAAAHLAEERPALRALPSAAIPSDTSYYPVVRRWSTIRVAHRTYSVPAQLMGHTVEARVHPNVVEVRYRDQVVQTMPRLRKEDEHHIDYRHVIGWLVRKPGAFARYRYRENLYPSVTFRRAYDALVRTHGERADVEYLRILHLAATVGEARVVEGLAAVLDLEVASIWRVWGSGDRDRTWTYLMNADPFRNQIGMMLTGPGRTTIAIYAVAMKLPLLVLLGACRSGSGEGARNVGINLRVTHVDNACERRIDCRTSGGIWRRRRSVWVRSDYRSRPFVRIDAEIARRGSVKPAGRHAAGGTI